MRLAVAMVLAIPALLHGQDTDDQEKKEKRAQLIIHANYLQEIPTFEWIPLALFSLHRFFRTGRTRWSVAIAVCLEDILNLVEIGE